jgi:hypothetical protein
VLASACYDGVAGDRDEGGGDAADDDAGEGGDDAGDDGSAAACADDGPSVGAARMRLLTRYEYDNTVRDLLGDTTEPARAFAPENRSGVFENDAVDH